MILLREKRREKNLSQQALSAITGVPQQTISKIESEETTNPGIETLALLAMGLDCEIMDLYVMGKPDDGPKSEVGYGKTG